MPPKRQLLTHNYHKINCGANGQYTHTVSPSPVLDKKGDKQVQEIVSALLFYAQAVNIKVLVAINAIGAQQASATEATKKTVAMLLDYVATYTNDGILYCTSDMVLATHADAGFHNETKDHSRAGEDFFLVENDLYHR
jgi:hypothetical protein